ncbi:hypothetical protein SNE40_009554 [Patella caerulea]|uniref:Uncharacterized protein n=2 Tax=Patella caerulea TaxID=87958 RepID=A0AAN8JSU6_PATCE
MSLNRRKKTAISTLCLGVLVYIVVQVTYFQQEFSPLKVLASAESEAHRLLKFITHYHYQCDNSLYTGNSSAWRICVDTTIGINADSNITKLSYSLGAEWDFSFEDILSRNLSFQQFIFLHKSVPPLLNKINGTHIYKTIIVPNDPADFGRNSFDTQTLNNVMDNLHHDKIDILKIESLFDMTESHELLFYLVKDKILSKVKQLHILIDIDKIDDDYLYHWYRTLYIVFHEGGFRLYHTGASDPLCLQVTMMESCRYYLSFVHNPGPSVPVLFPPSIDGSYDFEEERILDYVEDKSQECDEPYPFPNSESSRFDLCGFLLRRTSHRKCKIFIFRSAYLNLQPNPEFGKCEIISFVPKRDPSSSIPKFIVIKQSSPASKLIDLSDIIGNYLKAGEVNIVYISRADIFWSIISPILNTGVLQIVDHLTADVDVLKSTNNNPLILRHRYSELKRIEAFNFHLNQIERLSETKLYYQSSSSYLLRISYSRKTM